jgi:hypothetical protein
VVAEDVQLSFQIPYDGSFGYWIRGAVTRVNATTGGRTIVSTNRRFDPVKIAIEAGGSLVVTEIDLEAIVRIHSISGDRVIVSGCTIVAPLCPAQQLVGGGPAIATLVATDTGRKAIIRVDPISGDRAILSQ